MADQQESFDLVAIGSGPGGLRAAMQAAKAGKKVAVVDRNPPGGACVFLGTVPSKSLREAAQAAAGFPAAIKHMRDVVRAESDVAALQMARNGVRFFRGEAEFSGPREVMIQEGTGVRRLMASFFVIATGTSPIRRPEFDLGGGPVYDSDSLLALEALPRKMLVIGAGVIGCEYASIYARLGAQVTLVDRRQELLRCVDHEVACALQQQLVDSGIRLELGAALESPCRTGEPGAPVAVRVNGRPWSGDCVLVCLGRQPNTAGLGLERIGVKLDDRGQIQVSPTNYRTSLSHVCAVGDVIGPPALAATSGEQGRIAVSHLLDIPCEPFPAAFPVGIYTIPEVSSFGALETELREKEVPHVVGRARFCELARGLINGQEKGFVKLLVHRESRKILGVHAFGPGASELIHIGQVAHALGAPIDFLVQNVFNYPTFAEAYKVAALQALNQIRGHKGAPDAIPPALLPG